MEDVLRHDRSNPCQSVCDKTERIRQILVERGHFFLEEPRPPRSVRLRTNGRAIIASLTFYSGVRQIVAKLVPPNAQINCPKRFFETHERLRAQDSVLARSLPRFYGFEPDCHCVLMEYVNGNVLQTELIRTIWHINPNRHPCMHYLREVGRTLQAFHRRPAAALGISTEPRINSGYLADFEKSWTTPLVRSHLFPEYRNPNWLCDRLSPAFFLRRGDRLMMADIQAKNVIARPSGEICFIDVEYICGNPAVELAQFLCGLDRLRLRYWFSLSAARQVAWKQCLLDAYFEKADPEAAGDMLFFYPFVLLRTMEDHLATHPRFRAYLCRFYINRLNRFLRNVETGSVPWQKHL